MVLSYEKINLEAEGRASLIEKAKVPHDIEDRDGELIIQVQEDRFGDALFSFIQGIVRISDITYTRTERVRSLFFEEWRELVSKLAPKEQVHFNYNDPDLDPKKEYPIDCMVERGMIPFFIFGIANDEQCLAATVSLMKYESLGKKFHSIAIFEDLEEIKPRNYAMLSNTCEKQLATVQAGRERLEKYVDRHSGLATS